MPLIGYPTIAHTKETVPTTFAGDVMNVHQNYKKGVNVAATDPTKKVSIGTETAYKSLMLQLWATNQVNKIKFLSPNIAFDAQISFPTNLESDTPNEILFKDLPAEIEYKVIDTATNSIINLRDENIAADAAIQTTKLVDSANFLLKTLDNSLGAHYFDMSRITIPSNPAVDDARFYNRQIDSNNDGWFCLVKKNGSFQEVQIV